MTDEAKALVERLRDSFTYDQQHYAPDPLVAEAADLIETQAREIERLRNKLGFAIRTLEEEGYSNDGPTLTSLRAALGESHD